MPQQAATAVRSQFPGHPPELTAVVDPRNAEATRAKLVGPLLLADRPGLGDHDDVADLATVLLVMRLELRGAADVPAVQPMLAHRLHGHDDRLLHLVADDAPHLG